MAPAGVVEEAGGVALPLGAETVLERPAAEFEVVLLAPGDAVPLGAETSAADSEGAALSLLPGVVLPLAVVLAVGVWLLDLRVEAPTSFLKRELI